MTEKDKAIRKLITNWSGDEMRSYVKECEEVLDDLVKPGALEASRCEAVSDTILALTSRLCLIASLVSTMQGSSYPVLCVVIVLMLCTDLQKDRLAGKAVLAKSLISHLRPRRP